MAKKSMIEREKKRIKLHKKYALKRSNLLKTLDSQKSYIDVVRSTNQFTQEAETLLKEAISSTKTQFATL